MYLTKYNPLMELFSRMDGGELKYTECSSHNAKMDVSSECESREMKVREKVRERERIAIY